MEVTRQIIRNWSRAGSSVAFGEAALELATNVQSISLLSADLPSYSGWLAASEKVPGQFYNVGIAEQNLIGIACGMAREGITPFAASYASFSAGRCFDQVRIGMGYMGLPVKLVGMASGFSIGVLGATHMALDDIALMRTIPGITILSPADCLETVKATEAAAKIDGPVYLRLTGGLPNPVVYKEDYDFIIGRSLVLREGSDIAIIATGSMVHEALRAAKRLGESGVDAMVVDMHTIAPFDCNVLADIASSKVKMVVTVEEHYVSGGLGTAVLEHYSNSNVQTPLLRIGAMPQFYHAANYQDLLVESGLNAEGIATRILDELQS